MAAFKSIKIAESNEALIRAFLDGVNGKATAHTFTQFYEIKQLADEAEKQLQSLGVPKKVRAGASVRAVSGSRVPAAYKYPRTLSTLTIERRSSAWYITGMISTLNWAKSGIVQVFVTEAQDAAAVAALRSRYNVKTATLAA